MPKKTFQEYTFYYSDEDLPENARFCEKDFNLVYKALSRAKWPEKEIVLFKNKKKNKYRISFQSKWVVAAMQEIFVK